MRCRFKLEEKIITNWTRKPLPLFFRWPYGAPATERLVSLILGIDRKGGGRLNKVMRVQLYIIMVLVSLLMWGSAYNTARDTYRAVHVAEMAPKLQMKQRLDNQL